MPANLSDVCGQFKFIIGMLPGRSRTLRFSHLRTDQFELWLAGVSAALSLTGPC